MIDSKPLHYKFETITSQHSALEKTADIWEVCHIVSGTGLLSNKEIQMKVRSGDLFLIPPNVSANFHFEESITDNEENKFSRTRVIFHDNILDKFVTILPKLKEQIGQLRKQDTIIRCESENSDLITRVIWKMKDLQDEERASALLKLVLLLAKEIGKNEHDLSTKNQKAQKNLELVNLYIMHNASRKIKLEDVSKQVNMNRFTFCTFFRKNTGKTFFSYLEEYRIRLACQMLEEDESSISDICYKAGFNDVPHFNRTFKRIMGISPKEYRKQK